MFECTICEEKFETLEDRNEHVIEKHRKAIVIYYKKDGTWGAWRLKEKGNIRPYNRKNAISTVPLRLHEPNYHSISMTIGNYYGNGNYY